MPTRHIIDAAATWDHLALMSSEPRKQYGTDVQDQDQDGTPKWNVQLAATSKRGNGSTNNEIVKVTVAAASDPVAGITPFASVELDRLELGVMRKDNGGFQLFYRAAGIRSANGRKGGE